MSGSRAILLKLSVQDADLVLQTLRNVGTQGEAALARLDAAAQRAAGTGGGSSGGGIAGLRGQLANVGFQVQDFAVQVQGGTSALIALSQQGSQLLGAFGPAGAIAGAVLTVGLLAARLIDLGKASEAAAEAEKKHQEALDSSRQAYESAIERSERLARARIAEARASIEARAEAERTNLRNLNDQVRAQEENLQFLRSQMQGRGVNVDTNAAPIVAERQRLAAEAERTSTRLAEIDAERIRLQTFELYGRPGGEQYGPPAPSASDMQARDPKRSSRALQQRLDVPNAVAVTVDRISASYDEWAERQNLVDAGLERGAGILQQYERDMQVLELALNAQVINQDQYTAAVERGTLALGRNLDQIRLNAQKGDRFARDLGNSIGNAFEGAIIRGQKLSDVLKQLANDLARSIFRSTVGDPLSNSLSAAAKPVLSSIGSWITSILPFADGGVMTSAGPLPLHRYAGGGIADRPQLALFGEGRTPEAYVPLPNGRAIPVEMRGGQGGVVLNLNIDARGAGPREIEVLRSQIPGIARSAVEDAFRRGGSLSRAARNA